MIISMRKLFLLILITLLNSVVVAQSWSELFDAKADMLYTIALKILITQYETVDANCAPAIVTMVIKNIPIIDNGEPLIDISTQNNNRISMLPNPLLDKPFYGPEYNSGLPNASKIRNELYARLVGMIHYLDELSVFFGYKPGQVSIKVFEGLRDLKTQEILFQNKLDEIKVSNPDFTQQEAEAETAKWVSPVKNNVPPHSTGAAIDIRLWNEATQDFIDLGKFGVIWGENKHAETFSEDCTDSQKLNRLYLLMAAAKAGLVNYTYEYWHFSYGDRYATYWQESDPAKRIAVYGSL